MYTRALNLRRETRLILFIDEQTVECINSYVVSNNVDTRLCIIFPGFVSFSVSFILEIAQKHDPVIAYTGVIDFSRKHRISHVTFGTMKRKKVFRVRFGKCSLAMNHGSV